MKFFKLTFFLLLLLIIPNISSYAKTSDMPMSFIRDDETEKFLKQISSAVFKAAGLDPDAVKIIIVNDPSINAFVADGQKLFIHTGLIVQANSAASLIGVIAHETGHIKGAHSIQKDNNAKEAGIESIAGYVLGLGTVLAGAPPEAGMAIGSAGQNIAARNFLAYSRDYENAADTVALNILKKIGISPMGLADILKQLLEKQKVSGDIADRYLLTHPVSEERIDHVLSFVKANPEVDKSTPPELEQKFARVKAKVMAFLDDPERTRLYYKDKNGADAMYARAISYHKEAKFEESMALVDQLIASSQSDPYFNELKAQFLFEKGDIDASVAQYRKALSLLGKSPMVRLKLSESLLSTKDPKKWSEATGQLQAALIEEPRSIEILQRLGLAYGKLNKLGTSYLYLAESSLTAKDKKGARKYLVLAEQNIDKQSQDTSKLKDLKKELDRLLDKE